MLCYVTVFSKRGRDGGKMGKGERGGRKSKQQTLPREHHNSHQGKLDEIILTLLQNRVERFNLMGVGS